jgi:hypothetical protein
MPPWIQYQINLVKKASALAHSYKIMIHEQDIDFQINTFTPFISLSLGGEGQGEGEYQENVKLFI